MSLHEIRNKESEIKRRIAMAQDEADDLLNQARERAERIKKKAHEKGKKNGEAEAQKILTQAQQEADRIIERARHWTRNFSKGKDKVIDEEVNWAMDIVLGRDDNKGRGK